MRKILELSVTPFSFEGCTVDSSGRAWATCLSTAPYIFMERCLICRREVFAFTSICLSTHDSSVVIMTKFRVGRPGNRRSIVSRDRDFVFFAVSRLVQGPTQPALKWVLRVSFSGNKGVRACIWPLTTTWWRETLYFHPPYVVMVRHFIKHRENFTLHLYGKGKSVPLQARGAQRVPGS